MYGQPKVHKPDIPLREIVDCTGSVTKEIDRYISRILLQYVGKTEYHVKNSSHFVQMIKDLKVEEDEILVSYDVTALYPSVPQEEAINIIYETMVNDKDLEKKTTMTARHVTELLKLCVKTTYFAFNKKLYQQIDGLAIGAATSGPGAELFMERLESKAIATFKEPPGIWKRYVDDTFSKLKRAHVDQFLIHLNNQHPRIKFTTETQENSKIAFLDTLIHVLQNGSTKVTIYRKATHTDQYLDFKSNHPIKQKTGIFSTFKHRIKELVTEEKDKKEEMRHVRKALKRCGHPNWTLFRKERKKTPQEKVERRGKVVLPYVKGKSENLARIFKRYDIETIHKPTTKIKNLICNNLKDKVEDLDKTGAVYYNWCKKHKKKDYVGKTERVLRERMYEHRVIDHKTAKRAASISHEEKEEEPKESQRPTRRSSRSKNKVDYKTMNEGQQIMTEGSTEFSAHMATERYENTDVDHTILMTDDNWYRRGIKEAIAIRKIQPTLNQDDGRYHLSKMYDRLIRTSVTMKLPYKGTEDTTSAQTN